MPEGDWGRRLAGLLLGDETRDTLIGQAVTENQQCLAFSVLGQLETAKGDRDIAARDFQAAIETCPPTSAAFQIATAERKRLTR